MDNNLDLEYDRLLGEGSYGKVFLVKQQDGQKFAVKEIDLSKCDDTGRTQAVGEATLLSRVKQENILTYVESVINDDCLYIVTEYCDGGDMEDYLQLISKQGTSVPESLVSEWILQLGFALKYLHDQKILHRDMKTKNIFLKDDLTVKLGDLGIAKVLDLNQSKADTFIGTPSYMSPELFTGKSYNHKTDIWGLGCCTYEMMTLKRAFQGKALWTLIREIKNGKVLELPDRYSLEIRTLVQDMMSQSPEARPSAKEIVQNDLLLYHRGQAHDDVGTLPTPRKEVENKRASRISSNLTGSGSGSFNKMLQKKNRSEEDKFRQSIASVCEKINTLHLTGKSTVGGGGFDTFVDHGNHGNDGSDDELEAVGTILDSTLIKQYTEQLDTFVYKGGSDKDSDSDYSTGGSLGNKKGSKEASPGMEDADKTLLRQYSNQLEDLDTMSDGDNEHDTEETDDSSWVPTPYLSQSNNNQSALETLNETMKYKYSGLKDTFALRPNRRWKTPSKSESNDKSNPASSKKSSKVKRSSSDKVTKSSKKSGFPEGVKLSASMSATGALNGSGDKASDPRLVRTLNSESQTKVRTSKMKTCDRIEQSAKSVADKQLKSTKQAFIDLDSGDTDGYTDDPGHHVMDMMSHLRDNLTPYTPDSGNVNSDLSETVRSAGSDDHQDQESPVSKGKKKKTGFLKKQSEAKKKSPEIDQAKKAETNVRLFTRAQSAKFVKDEDEDSVVTSVHKNGRQTQEELNHIMRLLHNGHKNTLTMDHILFIQRELASGIGVENLRQVLDIMGMVQDKEEMQFHVRNILGPKLFEEYKQHLGILRTIEVQELTGSS